MTSSKSYRPQHKEETLYSQFLMSPCNKILKDEQAEQSKLDYISSKTKASRCQMEKVKISRRLCGLIQKTSFLMITPKQSHSIYRVNLSCAFRTLRPTLSFRNFTTLKFRNRILFLTSGEQSERDNRPLSIQKLKNNPQRSKDPCSFLRYTNSSLEFSPRATGSNISSFLRSMRARNLISENKIKQSFGRYK